MSQARMIAMLEELVIAMGQIPETDWVSRIAEMKPDFYLGQEDPAALEGWIRQFEKILNAIGCPPDRKVDAAVYYLRGEADNWWVANKDTLLAQENFDWESLKISMWDRFYPRHVKLRKYEEFLALKQNGGSVTDYYNKFTKLSRFAGSIIPTEDMKVCHFVDGLDSDVQKLLITVECTTVHEAYRLVVDGWRVQEMHGTRSMKRKENQGDKPQHVKWTKYKEFLALKQNGGSLTDYYNRFTKLSCFDKSITLTEDMKVSRFVQGLDFSIKIVLIIAKCTTVHEAYGVATDVWGLRRIRSIKRKEDQGDNSRNKRFKPNPGSYHGNFLNQNTYTNRPARHFYCKSCGNDHPGVDCNGEAVACRTCGKKGHRAYECRVGTTCGQLARTGGNTHQQSHRNNLQNNESRANFRPNHFGNKNHFDKNSSMNFNNQAARPQGNNYNNASGGK